MDLSTLTAAVAQEGSYGPAASLFSSQQQNQQQQQQPQLSSIYSAHSTLAPTNTPSVSPGLSATNNNNHNNNNIQYHASATEILFNEIKSICNDFEISAAANYQQLTPPQSPPPKTHQMYAPSTTQFNELQPQQVQKPNFVYAANSSSQLYLSPGAAIALNPFQYAERSFVDLQLESNDCLDKTFVFDNNNNNSDNDAPVAVGHGMPNSFSSTDNTDQMALDLIDELLRNKTKEVHENYVLVNTTQTSFEEIAQEKSLKSRNEAAVRAITSLRFEEEDVIEFCCDDSATQFSTPSYGNSLASSPSRSGSPVDSQDDDDWLPEQEQVQQEKSLKKSSNKLRGAESSSSGKAKRRPYERGGGEVEKKSRKKEQNKNAATRYRQKKKQEVETILDEESRLKKVNKKLVSQFNDARREMKYLRNLLRDMYSQNGIVIWGMRDFSYL